MYPQIRNCIFLVSLLCSWGCNTYDTKNKNGIKAFSQLSDTFKKSNNSVRTEKLEDSTFKPAPSTKEPVEMTFFDSIASHFILSHDQIKNHTLIDSAFWTKRFSRADFYGDSIYFRDGKYPLVVLNYSDNLVCSDKILLIFATKSMLNTDYRIVESICDDDYGSGYSRLSYKILNDSTVLLKQILRDDLPSGKSRTTSKSANLYIDSVGKFKPLPGFD